MKLTIHDKTMLIYALENAIAYDEALIDAHKHICNDKDVDEMERITKSTIMFMDKLKTRMEKAKKYHTAFSG